MDSPSASSFSSSSSTSSSTRINSSNSSNNSSNSNISTNSNNDLVPANNNQAPLLRNMPAVISLESVQGRSTTENNRGDGPASEPLRNQMDEQNRENDLQTANNERANCPRDTSEEVFFLKLLLLKTRRKKEFLKLKLNQEKEMEVFLLRQHQNSLLAERRNQQPTLNHVSPTPAELVLPRLDGKAVVQEPELALPRLEDKTIIQQPGSSPEASRSMSSGQTKEQGETESPTAKLETPKRKRGRPRKNGSTKYPAPKRSKVDKPKGTQKPKGKNSSRSDIEIRHSDDDASSIINNDTGSSTNSSSGGNESESEKRKGKQRSRHKKISLSDDDVFVNGDSANFDTSSSSSNESKSEKSKGVQRPIRKKFSLSSSESEDSESLLLGIYCTAGIL